jgi:hypothetical protein
MLHGVTPTVLVTECEKLSKPSKYIYKSVFFVGIKFSITVKGIHGLCVNVKPSMDSHRYKGGGNRLGYEKGLKMSFFFLFGT